MKLFIRLKDKKGVVLESSVIFMIVIFSFCFLLSGLTISSHYRARAEKIMIEQELAQEAEIEAELEYILDEYLNFLTTFINVSENANAASVIAEDNQNGEDAGGETPETQGQLPKFSDFVKSDEHKERFEDLVARGYAFYDSYDRDLDNNSYVFTLVVNKGGVEIVTYTVTKTANGIESVKTQR